MPLNCLTPSLPLRATYLTIPTSSSSFSSVVFQIDVSELAAGLKSFGVSMTSAQLVAFRDEIDTDGDFRISLAEFEEGVRLRQEGILESPVALRNRARLADAAWVQVLG